MGRKAYYPAPPKELAVLPRPTKVRSFNYHIYAIREYDRRYRKRILDFLYQNTIDLLPSNQLNLPDGSPLFIAYQTLAYPYSAVGILYFPDLYYIYNDFVIIKSLGDWYSFRGTTAQLMLEGIQTLYGITLTPELLGKFRLPVNSPTGKMVISRIYDQKLSVEELAMIANGHNKDNL